jgi:hypothetical protein
VLRCKFGILDLGTPDLCFILETKMAIHLLKNQYKCLFHGSCQYLGSVLMMTRRDREIDFSPSPKFLVSVRIIPKSCTDFRD